MPSISFGEPFLIPRDILSDPEQKIYDEIKEKNPEELKHRYKWWSMYDIMKFYGSGLIPKANAANFFPFKIDLTAPGLLQNKYRDADLVNGFEVAMTKLNEVSNSIADYYNQANANWSKQTTEVALSRPATRGGKYKKRNQHSDKTKKNNKNKNNKKGGDAVTFPPIVVNINKKINEIFSGEVLKSQCTQALYGDVFHSRNRIFLVDNQLPTYTQATYEQLRANADKLKADKIAAKSAPAALAPAAAPAAAPAQLGGRKQKTRKLKYKQGKRGKKCKKMKSRRS